MNKLILIVMAICLNVQICKAYKNGTLWPGKVVRLDVDASAGYFNPQWSVNNPTVSLSGSGFYRNVTADRYFGGTCIITCSYDYYVGTSKYNRTVTWEYDCADNTFTLSPTNMNIGIGKSKALSWTFDWATYKVPAMQFSGYDPSIIDVSPDGTVLGKKEGSTTVYASSDLGSNKASCVVHVSEAYVSPVTVTIPAEVSLESGGTYQFLPTVTPEDDELQITWTTENPEVASVDNKGKVTGVSTGVTIITVSINGGLAEAYSIVKVRNGNLEIKANPVGGIVEKGVVVELAVEIQDAVIYYTTDGSYPMENPNLYAKPICVDRPLLVNALAYHKDYGLSELFTASYDVTSLKTESYSPGQGMDEVKPDAIPVVTFNEVIKEGDTERITMSNRSTGKEIGFEYVIDGNELSIVPDSLLEIGQYEIRIPSYAVTNSVGEPNGDILYQFSVTSTGKEEYAYLDSYFRLMDNGNLYVWHKDFPDLNTSDESIGEHLVLEDVKSLFTPYHMFYRSGDYPSQQYYYIDDGNTLWGWGWLDTSENPIGNGTTKDVPQPAMILGNAKDFKNSAKHKGALGNGGMLYLWGDKAFGKIGDGGTMSGVAASPVGVLSDVEMFDLGQLHTIAVTKGKKLFAWGFGHAIGQYANTNVPTLIDDNVVYACSGQRHNLYIKSDKTLWSFGENNPCIGAGISSSTEYVGPVKILSDVEKCYTGAYESLALKTNGDLYQWGYAAATTSYLLGRTPVLALQDVKDVQIAGMTVYVLKNDGTVWVRGENGGGQLGLGHESTHWDYYESFHSPDIGDVETIWANANGCYALKKDGSLWGWGFGLPCDAGSSDVPIELKPGIKYLEGVSISEGNVMMEPGQAKLLHFSTVPESAAYASVEWESSDEHVMTVSPKGIVRAINPGEAFLTVIVKNEIGFTFKSTCQVVVTDRTDIKNEKVPLISFWISNGVLHIDGLSKGEMVNVYDCSGKLCGTACTSTGRVDFALSRKGIYIVKTNKGKVSKIAVGH